LTKPIPTGKEVHFGEEEIIVSKTDLRGVITYANDLFLRVSGYTESEVLGKPHSMIRHPDMPRVLFEMLWQRLQSGKEMFAYVKNMTKSGDHYWVLAHVTPTFDREGRISNYHSNRRWADREALRSIEPLYARLKSEEERHADRRQGMAAARALLERMLSEQRRSYDQFVFSLVDQGDHVHA